MSIYYRENGVLKKLNINANDIQVLDVDGKYTSHNLEDVLKQVGSGTETHMNQIDGRVGTLETKLSDATNVIPSVTYGMNNKIVNDGTVATYPKFGITGKTIINLLGKDGNCEDLSKWGTWQTTMTLDTTNKMFGNNGIKITLTNTGGNIDKSKSSMPSIDNTKYYLFSAYLKNGNATNGIYITAEGTSVTSSYITDSTKFTRVGVLLTPAQITATTYFDISLSGANGQYGYVDGIMINEVSASEYALGASALLNNYPYVDSYACLQNPYVEVRHDNLVINGNGELGTGYWIKDTSSTSTLSISGGKFKLSQTSTDSHWATQRVKVKPNTNYYISSNFSDTTNCVINVTDPNNAITLTMILGTFNTGNYSEIGINMQTKSGSPVGDYYFDSIMLIEGTTAPTSYKSCRIEKVVLETKLTSDDSIVYDNGEVTGLINWKHRTLFGKDYDPVLNGGIGASNSIGYRFDFPSITTKPNDATIIGVKYDGKILKTQNTDVTNISSTSDCINPWNNNHVYIDVANSDSGWTSTVYPNVDEIKAYMNGWKAVYDTSSISYNMWVSIVDGSIPPITINSALTANSTSSTSLTVTDGTKFAINDVYMIFRNGVKVGFGTVTSISGNVLTTNNTNTALAGDIVCRTDNGYTYLHTYCKNNIAPNYEGYQLHNKLATPEPITDDNVHIHGDIPKLDVGDNYLYLDSGYVLGEVNNPWLYSTLTYGINSRSADSSLKSWLKYKAEYISSIYKNSLYNNQVWTFRKDYFTTYGVMDAYCDVANFDTSATYTVDYKILATTAPQIGSISCVFSKDIVTSINKLEEDINNKQTHDSILDTIIDKGLYEIQTVAGLYGKGIYNNSIVASMTYWIPISLKKAIPIITINSITALYHQGTGGASIGLLNSEFNFSVSGITTTGFRIIITYTGSNSTIINNMLNNGWGFSSITFTADCRGRI